MKKEKLLYTRYSDERDPAYAVYTQIFEDENGARTVRKCAGTQEAAAHLRHIYNACVELSALYAGSGLSVNRCVLSPAGEAEKENDDAGSGETLTLEYISGETLEMRFDRMLKKDGPEAVKAGLHAYVEEAVPRDRLEPFVMTEEFRKVFGDADLKACPAPDCRIPHSYQGLSLPVSDIDLICSNIICTENGRQIIDYEWTFDFPVPAAYIVFRIVFYYVTVSALRRELNTDGIFEEFGISEEEVRAFREMEFAFQKSVQGRHVPLRSLYSRISPGGIRVAELAGEADSLTGRKNLQVFFRREGNYSEPVTYRMNGSRIETEIPVPAGTDLIRLDPGDLPCFCRLGYLAFDGREESAADWQANGKKTGGDSILFAEEDPQILVPVCRPQPKILSVLLDIYDIPAEALQEISGRLRGGRSIRDRLQRLLWRARRQ